MKKSFKRFIPDKNALAKHKALRVFGKLIHDPNIWHLNRNSVARAFSVGLFCAWIPVPFQMVLAAGGAILFRSNLPLSVALVWLTNPATMPPLFYFAYKIGAWLMSLPPRAFSFRISIEWLLSALDELWQPFLLGCFICGLTCAIVGNIAIRLVWRYFTVQMWKKRNAARLKRSS